MDLMNNKADWRFNLWLAYYSNESFRARAPYSYLFHPLAPILSWGKKRAL